MKRSSGFIIGLLAFGSGAAILLAADASKGFHLLEVPAAALLAALGAAALVGAEISRRRSRGSWNRLRPAAALMLAAVVLLALNAVLHAWRQGVMLEGSERRAQAEINRRADLIQGEFKDLLLSLQAPLDKGRERLATLAGGQQEAFDLVDSLRDLARCETEGRGLTVYSKDGKPLAWAGASFPVPQGMLDGLAGGRLSYRAVAEQHLSRLYALWPAGGAILVAEATVSSRLDPRARDLVLPVLAGDEAVDLRLQDFRAEATGFDDYLARHGDRYTGGLQGERPLLFVALRAPDRSFLGYVRLRGMGSSDIVRTVDRRHRLASAAIVVLMIAGLGAIAAAPRRVAAESFSAATGRLAALLAVIWGGRVLISWFPGQIALAGYNLFDSSLFASAGLFHLLRSPADLFLTAVALLGSAVAIQRGCGRLASTRGATGGRIAGAAGWAGLVVVAGGALLFLRPLAAEFVGNSSLNLLDVDLVQPSPPTLMLQVSALIFMLSVFLMAQGFLGLAGAAGGPLAGLARLSPRPGDGVSRWSLSAFVPGIVVAAALYDPLLASTSQRATESLFENVLMPEVIGQGPVRVAMLRSTLDALKEMRNLPDRIAGGEDPTGAAMALDIWLDTPLAGAGYDASLLVEDSEGHVISRFARNLPPAFDSRAPEGSSQSGEPMVERVPFLDVTKRILHSRFDVVADGRTLGSITVHILDEFENLPFLTPETPYVRALASQARRIVSLPASAPSVLHTVFQPDGLVMFTNQREAPRLPEAYSELQITPGASRWLDASEESGRVRYLFFGDGWHLFSLGFPLPGLMERVARGMRVMFMALGIFGITLVPVALAGSRRGAGEWWSRMLETFGRTHYRKLLVTFTTAALVPLVVLSVLMSEFIRNEIDKDIEDRGRQGIQSSGSLVRTILEREGQASLGDDTLYWLSLLVGEDVNLYQDGEISATSRRELFSSGLISPRLDGEVYRALALGGRSFAMNRQTLKDFEYRTITAPVLTGTPRQQGLISLPLDAQAFEATLRAREVSDVVLITFAGMMLLMGAVGYALARRVSRPIRNLSAAAARIAAGDLDAVVEPRPRDETGDLIASFNNMARSIKEHREDLERRKDYIEKVLLNATIGVISTDRSGAVVTANPAAATILDLPRLGPGADLPALFSHRGGLEPLARAFAGATGPQPRDVEVTLPGSPSERTVRARAVPFLDGEGIILLLEDVTETVRSNRLSAWAEMARRIAHEIKNPLTPIQLSAEHLRRVHAEGGPDFPEVMEECLQTIMHEVAELRRISAEFSAYARIPTPRKEPTPMSDLLEETVRPYRRAMPPGVTLELDLTPDLPVLAVDRSLIRRALVNLIENALQAMPRGGRLTVRASAGADSLAIEVVDTGVGMDAAAMGRIFEPYFSTKDAGTGLGLAIARKAIEEHGGAIEVSSEPGRGTTMRIALPCPREEGAPDVVRSAGHRSG